MSKEVRFVDGLRAFKPHANAPGFVKAALQINRPELIEWLRAQDGDDIRLDLKESKNGAYYTAVNDFKPDPSRKEGTNTGASAPNDFGPPPPDDFDDDIPF